MRRKENVRLKIQITAYMLALFILISPIFNLGKNSKGASSRFPTVSASENDNDTKRTYKELIKEVQANYNFDFSNMIIPTTLDSNSCSVVYDFEDADAKDIYNKMTELLETIISNSNSYIEGHLEYISLVLDELEDEYCIDKIAIRAILKDVISDILKKGSNKDICLIKDLRVLISYDENIVSSDTYVKYFEKDKLLVILPNNIRKYVNSTGGNYWDTLEYAVLCEFNRIRLKACSCGDVNTSFPYDTIKDASVVSELYNYGNTSVLVSSKDIRNESLILLLGLFHDDGTIDNYYKAIFNNDMGLFYKFCGVNDNDSIYRLNRILYTMDIIEGNISLDTNVSLDDIGYDYRVDIFGMVINNMIKYTTYNKDFKLRDNLILVNAIRDFILSDIDLVDSDVLDGIEKIKKIYFEFLSKHYKHDIDKLEEMLQSDEIIRYASVLVDICNRNGDFSNFDISYTLYCSKIIKNNPLLWQIFATYGYLGYDSNVSTIKGNLLIRQRTPIC